MDLTLGPMRLNGSWRKDGRELMANLTLLSDIYNLYTHIHTQTHSLVVVQIFTDE